MSKKKTKAYRKPKKSKASKPKRRKKKHRKGLVLSEEAREARRRQIMEEANMGLALALSFVTRKKR